MTSAELAAYQLRHAPDRPAPSLGQPVERESVLHGQIVAECKQRRWIALHGRMDAATGRTIGEPDFTILASDGRLILVECKRRGGKLSEAQQAFRYWAGTLGHTVHVCYSIEDFRAVADGEIKHEHILIE